MSFSLSSLMLVRVIVYWCWVAQLCPSLCDPMDCSTPGFPVLHHLPELTQIHVQWVCVCMCVKWGHALPFNLEYGFDCHKDPKQWLTPNRSSISHLQNSPVLSIHSLGDTDIPQCQRPWSLLACSSEIPRYCTHLYDYCHLFTPT